ncbi:hypothetical protein ES703_118289 [subsurface metagenome]
MKSFSEKQFSNLPVLNNFTALLEITCSPSLTDALIKYTLEAIQKSLLAIRDIYTLSQPFNLVRNYAHYIIFPLDRKSTLKKQVLKHYFYAETNKNQPSDSFDFVLEEVPEFFADEYPQIRERKGYQADDYHSHCD